MSPVDFHALSPWLNAGIFLLAAVAVWIAGSRLAVYADTIAERTGWSSAFLGLVLLAGVTELPELATTLVAASGGEAALTVNNLFGGIAMQTAILVIADLTLRRGALSFFSPKPELLLQGLVLIGLLALTVAASAVGEFVVIGGVGLWSTLLFCMYLVAVHRLWRHDPSRTWRPVDLPDEARAAIEGDTAARHSGWSLSRLGWAVAAVAVVVLAAGVVLVGTADALAEQTGLSKSFVGATLLASSTSLPEVSTTVASVRVGAYAMAFANIFGSNAIMIAVLFIADIAYRDGPIIDEVDPSAKFAMGIGMLLTAIYLIGLVERKDRAVLRLGIDSWLVAVLYLGSLVVLYRIGE